MASIKINNLQPAGSDLFSGSENYLNELTNQELNIVNGGIISGGCIPRITICTLPDITIVLNY